ncbi:MAG: hypothetical protein Q4F97_10400 [Bacteroidales bacterium]|nr:hypothetical protein [Bacteroidales bacterium]
MVSEIRFSGRVKEITKYDDDFAKWVLEYPSKLMTITKNGVEAVSDYVSFLVFEGISFDSKKVCKIGSCVDVYGEIISNCKKDGNSNFELKIIIRNIVERIEIYGLQDENTTN